MKKDNKNELKFSYLYKDYCREYEEISENMR
ncbi:hypothetical protein BXY57_1417 [Thermoflavifilum aggregans]|uniref:Uncharacterized protein n=1 Tax=Thermoflavifilum aggregans TaxID=454188 RepID=A0A2M9CV81_9BACT|nr:hypothetical protein BXY57_1417 [Thermoflavifilum aggregans]